MLNNCVIESAVSQSLPPIFSVHQFLQVVQMTGHTNASRLIFLKLFGQQKYFFQECACRNNSSYLAIGIYVFLFKGLTN